MSTLVHAQYNSPMPLYSPENVQVELERATGQPSPRAVSGLSGKINLEQQSGAYRALHGNAQLPPQHSARYDEPRKDEYPHYKGYVDPNLQSPSFKRLQNFSGTEDQIEASQQSRPAQSRSPQPQWYPDNPPVAQRDPASSDERDHPLDPDFAQKIAEAERPKVPAAVVPSWARKAHEKRAQWDEDVSRVQAAEQRYFGAVPPTQPATAAPAAAYPSFGGGAGAGAGAGFGAPMPTPAAPASFSPRPTAPPAAGSLTFGPAQYKAALQQGGDRYDDKWKHHYEQFNFESGASGQQRARSPAPRPRSVEPEGWRSRGGGARPAAPHEKEPWMKPYVAPNVLNAKFSSTTSQNYRSVGGQPAGQNLQQPGFGGMYYGPPDASGQGGSSRQQTSSFTRSYREHSTERSRSPGYGAPSYGGIGTSAEAPAYNPISSAPSWAQKADEKHQRWQSSYESQQRPPLAPQRAPFSSGGGSSYQPAPCPASAPAAAPPGALWRNEAEAWQRKREMEEEIRRRAATGAGPGATSGGGAPQWRQQQSAPLSEPPGLQAPAAQKWQDASGASTKSQTQGSYLDEHGNQVNYTKEVYTSSDPGTQYSMLTQEEKKALEQPLEPGVVSRHVTSKYYKRSTYTSQTTTGGTQAPPVSSYPSHFIDQRQQQQQYRPTTSSAVRPTTTSYQVGQISPGVSQF